VVLTGACGRIAGLLLPALQERYDLTLLDARQVNRAGEAVPDVQTVDLLDKNRDSYRRRFAGADAVVHCAYVSRQDQRFTDASFATEMANIQLAYNVYQVAYEEKVRRVVVASSNHAADYYEGLILDGAWDVVTPEMRALSDNYYGWAKEAYEHLGFVFAVGRATGRPLENVQIRIGGPRETDVAGCPKGDLRRLRRALAVYISQRDMQQLFIKSIEAPDIRDEHGVPFQIFYGISANSHAFWSIANARRIVGYAPQDNSELRFRDLIGEHLEDMT
jgi:hypothetical protein